MELDKIPLWRGDHVGLKQLAEDFAQYLYLPRLKDTDVLLGAVREGLALLTWEGETFAFAEGYEADPRQIPGAAGRAEVCRLGRRSDLLVKPDVARQHLDAERQKGSTVDTNGRGTGRVDVGGGGTGGAGTGHRQWRRAAPRPW